MLRQFIAVVAVLNLASLPAFAQPATHGWPEETCDAVSADLLETDRTNVLELCKLLAYDNEDTRASMVWCAAKPP